MSDLDTIRKRHWQNPDGKCASADHAYPSSWPCETRQVLDALDACMKLRSERHRNADICTLEKAAMGADADRLAEALRDADSILWRTGDGPVRHKVREALRQHEAAKEAERER